MRMQAGKAECVCLKKTARAPFGKEGAVRGPARRESSTGNGLQRAVMERASHSGVNLCETGPERDRSLWRSGALPWSRLDRDDAFGVRAIPEGLACSVKP